MFLGRSVAALLVAGATLAPLAAFAGDATAPAAPPAAAIPAPPSPAAVAAADQLLIIMGVKENVAKTVPTMMSEFERNVATSRPDLRDSLREALNTIKPEFDKSAQQTYTKVEALLALAMSEKELLDVAAFFNSPTGKKYLAMQPIFIDKLQDVLGPWRQSLSTDIVAKAREQMKKMGVDF